MTSLKKCKYLLLLGVFAVMVVWRFNPLMPEVFFGDDLINYIAYSDREFASSIFQSLTAVYYEKYRPVFTILIGMELRFFGDQVNFYQWINIFIHSINAMLVLWIGFRLSKGNLFVGLMIASLAATSRFAVYQVTQVTGLLEGLGNFFFLAILILVIELELNNIRTNFRLYCISFCLILLEFFAIHTHERYIVMTPWLIAIFLLLPDSKSLQAKQRKLIILLLALPPLFNVVYKKILLKSDFFVAPGGTRFQLSFNEILERSKEACFSLFGFNYGPAYLTGAQIPSDPENFGWQMAVLFTITWTLLLLIAIKNCLSRVTTNRIAKVLSIPVMFLSLIVLIVLPAVLSIRLENRWLVQPFLLLLMISAWSIGRLENRVKKLGISILLVMSLSSFLIDSFISKSYSDLFFVSSAHAAKLIKRNMALLSLPSKIPLFFISEPSFCGWTLWNGEFFRVYGADKAKRAVECAINESELKWVEGGKVFIVDPAVGVSDVTTEFLARRKESSSLVK